MIKRLLPAVACLAASLLGAAPHARAEATAGEPLSRASGTPAAAAAPNKPEASTSGAPASEAATSTAPTSPVPASAATTSPTAASAASGSAAPAAASPASTPPAPVGPAREAPAAAPSAPPVSAEVRRARFREIARETAARYDLPFEMADAVMRVESAYNPGARGRDGEVGLMQVMPPTARMLGFSGTLEELAQPEINIPLGVRYLGEAWKLAKGDICTAAMKYRAGHNETRFSVLSVDYCVRVRTHLASLGYPVTGEVPKATFGFEARIGRGRGQVQWGFGLGSVAATKRLYAGRKLKSRAAWSAHDARMNALIARGRAFTGLR